MITVKEFEEQKQEVADYFVNKFLCKIIRKDDEVNHLLKLIDNLQPPRPTCATCEHFIQELDNAGSCRKLVANEIINFTDGIAMLVFTDFGCNWHSDYDEVKNAAKTTL